MPNYFEGGRPVCPHYLGAGNWYVRCANPGEDEATSLFFPGKTALIRHLTHVCGSFYYKARCPMAQAEDARYENRIREMCMERIVMSRRKAAAPQRGGAR